MTILLSNHEIYNQQRILEAMTFFVSESDSENKIDIVIDYYQHSRLSISASDVKPSELSTECDVDASPATLSP